MNGQQLNLELSLLEKNIKSALARKRITDMIAHYYKIYNKRTKDGARVHSREYALEQCKVNFYFEIGTCEDYIQRYS